jgi:hypothetical protein
LKIYNLDENKIYNLVEMSDKIFKKLYETKLYLRKDENRVRFWNIYLRKDEKDEIYYIHHLYGLIGGKITNPLPRKVISLKKALTKMNAEIKKKKLLGFSEKIDTNIVSGSVLGPMGAHKLDEYSHKLVFPVMVQHKLDGFRCIAYFDNNGNVTLYSKSMKPFIHLHHIKGELEDKFKLKNTYLDGELYSHHLKLNQISSIVMKKRDLTYEEEEESKQIVFMVFDIILQNIIFEKRFNTLKSIFNNIINKKDKTNKTNKIKIKINYIELVDCVIAENIDQVYELNNKYLMEGYEGVIVRNKTGLYIYKKKSYDVLRTKEFKSGVFTILNGKNGTGTYTNTIIWELKCNKSFSSNKSFNAIQMGTSQTRRQIHNAFHKDPSQFIGRKVKVKYLAIDDYGCVLRNPIVEEFVE